MLLHGTATDGQLFNWLNEQRAPVDFNNTDPLMNHKWYRNPFAPLRFSRFQEEGSVFIRKSVIYHEFFFFPLRKQLCLICVWHGCPIRDSFFRFSAIGKLCEREKYSRFFRPFHNYLKYCIGKMRKNRLSSRAVRPLQRRPWNWHH